MLMVEHSKIINLPIQAIIECIVYELSIYFILLGVLQIFEAFTWNLINSVFHVMFSDVLNNKYLYNSVAAEVSNNSKYCYISVPYCGLISNLTVVGRHGWTLDSIQSSNFLQILNLIFVHEGNMEQVVLHKLCIISI